MATRRSEPSLVAPRIGTPRDRRRPSLGPVVAEVAASMGLEFYGWQRLRADVCGELVSAGKGRRLAASTTLTMAGRQSGKTTAVTADVATRCLAPDLPALEQLVGHRVGAQHVAFTAQDRIGALGRWYEHVDMICSSELRSHVAKVVRKNGEECLHFTNGSRYRVVTPSRTGARGLALDMCVIDEALAHEPWLLDVVGPTMAQRDGARTSFGAQLVIVSNAGDERAELLNQQREIGRRAVAERDRSRVHLEWSCGDDDDVLDHDVWRRTIPTLNVPDGLSEAYLARQAETLGTDAFAREYLCRTVLSVGRQVIDLAVWENLPYCELVGDPVFAVELDPQRLGAVVVAVAEVGDVFAVQVVDDRDGVEWVVPFLELRAKGWPVVVDRYGPAATLIPSLQNAGVEVVEAASREVTDSAGLFVDLVDAHRVGHTRDTRLSDAVVGLARRQRGDRWAFDRYQGRPGPLIAASLAIWQAHLQVSQPAVW